MKRINSTQLFMLFCLVIPVTAYAVVNWFEKNKSTLPVFYKEQAHKISDFSLQNQSGNWVSLERNKKEIIVADFFFTHCPSICPIMTKNMMDVRLAYKNYDEVRLLSFTVDPERDSAQQLKAYIERFNVIDDNWDFLTGEKKKLYALARNSFKIVATDGDGGPNDFIHSERFILIDPEKRIRGYYDGTNKEEVNQLIKDIKKLKNEK